MQHIREWWGQRRKLTRRRGTGSVMGVWACVYPVVGGGDTAERRKQVSLKRWHLSKDLLEGRSEVCRYLGKEHSKERKQQAQKPQLQAWGRVIIIWPLTTHPGPRGQETYPQVLETGGSKLWTAGIENPVSNREWEQLAHGVFYSGHVELHNGRHDAVERGI